MKKSLLETLRERRLVCDGAMGTQLMLAGLANGDCGEAWNLSYPDRVLKIQRNYVEAGADCLITNTFGGSRLMLKRHGHVEQLREIIRREPALPARRSVNAMGLCLEISARWARFSNLTVTFHR